MAMVLSDLLTKAERSRSVWKDVDLYPGVRLLVTSMYSAEMESAIADAVRENGGIELTPAEIADLLAEHALRGWEGIESSPGVPAEFSTEDGKRLVAEYNEFRNVLVAAAMGVARDDFDREQETAKN